MARGSWGQAQKKLIAAFLALTASLAAAEDGGAPGAAQAAPGEIIDRVVAVVEGHVITLSELELEARVALVQRGGVQAAFAPLDEETLRKALELSIGQRLEVLNADRLQAFAVDRAEVAARIQRLQERFDGPGAFQAFLARHDADLEQLGAIVERAVRAERILDRRIRLRVQVSEAEVRRYYDAHAAELGGTYEALRGALREKLMRERYAQLAALEMAQARQAADVRRVAPFAREGRP